MIKDLISLIMPTRKRYSLASQFIKSLEKQTNNPKKVELLIYIDDDDSESLNLKSDIIPIKIFIGKRKTMGEYNTYLYNKSVGDIIMLANDDIRILTQSWDEKIREVHKLFKDKIYLAYPNDLYKGKSLCTFPIISRNTAVKLRRPFPEEYQGAFIDLHLLDIFKRAEKIKYKRIIYLENVLFEHLHYRTGKTSIDHTYKERNRFEDDNTFHNLREFRKKQAYNLFNNQKLTSSYLDKVIQNSDITKLNRVIIVIKYFFDFSLPLKWRIYLTSYFMARNIYKILFE